MDGSACLTVDPLRGGGEEEEEEGGEVFWL
jgi:hypothetical protein